MYTVFMYCKTVETMCNKTMKNVKKLCREGKGFKQVFVQHSSGIFVVLKDTENKIELS